MEIHDITEIEKQYQDEWLLFEVYETDAKKRPTKGRLIVHSPIRSAIDEIMFKDQSHRIYLTYSGPKPKKGMVSVL